MDAAATDVNLLTIRTRRDPAFPGQLFILVRTYPICGDSDAVVATETVSIESTLELVEAWLRESAATST
jgi:hypothetical protein